MSALGFSLKIVLSPAISWKRPGVFCITGMYYPVLPLVLLVMFACFHFYFPCPVLFLLLFLPTKELNWVLAFLPPAPFNLNQINSSSFGKEVRKRNNQPLDAAVSALIAFTLPSQDSNHPGLHSFPQAHQASPSRKDSAPMLMCHHTAPLPITRQAVIAA